MIPKSNVQTKQDLYSIMMLYVAPISTKHEKKLPQQSQRLGEDGLELTDQE
jgi:hypothetical protein